MTSKLLVGLVAIIILFLFFPVLQGSIDDFRADEFTESEPNLTNGAVATANFTLDQALYEDDINNITSITSNITEAGTITPTSYNGLTLFVTGLAPSETRTLTIIYDVSSLEDQIGLEQFAPYLMLFVLLAGLGFIVMLFVRRRG